VIAECHQIRKGRTVWHVTDGADTDRAAVEEVIGKYLHIDKQSAAFISLPAFPLGVDAVRLQRVVSSMKRFGLLPRNTNFQVTSMIG
jgi:hypothetical protein